MRLLIVEDSALVRKMYGLVFPGRDHELVAVEDGRQALEALGMRTEPYDIILLDLRMPDMDGVEFIKSVRRTKDLSRIPIVLTTVEQDDSPMMREARELGVAAVVKKPWKPQQLREVVLSILQDPAA